MRLDQLEGEIDVIGQTDSFKWFWDEVMVSLVWSVFTKEAGHAKCNICYKKVVNYGNTTNLKRHLHLNHPGQYNDIYKGTNIDNQPKIDDTINDIAAFTVNSRKQLLIAVICVPNFFQIENDNKTISGLFGPGYRYTLYPLLEVFNYTLECRDLSSTNYCAPNGTCLGTLKQMQLNEIDYAGTFSHLQLLSSSFENLTIGPVVGDKKCFIMYSPKIHVEQDVIGIGTVLESFGPVYWSLNIILSLIFSLLWSLVDNPSLIRSNCTISRLFFNASSTFFTLCFSALGQVGIRPRNNRPINRFILLSSILFFTLSISLNGAAYIYSISVKHDFLKLDTLSDVAKAGYEVTTLYGSCEQIISASRGSILRPFGLRNRPTSLTKLDKESLAKAFAGSKSIIITELYNIGRARILVYFEKINGTSGRQIYTSVTPVFSIPEYMIIPKSLDSKVAKKMIRNGYASFETGNWYNYRSALFDMIGLYNGQLCSRCFESARPVEETIISSLSIDRFHSIFILIAELIVISVIVFMVELIFNLHFH